VAVELDALNEHVLRVLERGVGLGVRGRGGERDREVLFHAPLRSRARFGVSAFGP